MPLRLLRWSVSAALGGFVFGYQLGVISGALLFVRDEFGLGAFEQGAIVSVLPLGAMVGGVFAGRLADAHGRRTTLILDALVLIAGTALSAVAPTSGVLLAARAVVGLGVGAASSTVPLYLSEIAPPALRGRLVTVNQLMVVTGILVSYGVNLIFASSGSWRWMFAVGIVPAVALLAGMLSAPESPAWLNARGRDDEARSVILQVAREDAVEHMLDGFRRLREQQRREMSIRELFASGARPALVTGIVLAAAQQFGGISAIIYFAPMIMEQTGLSASSSILYSVIIGVVNLLATIVSLALVDRVGRRPLLLGSLVGMAVSLALLGAALDSAAASGLSLASILVYIAAFAIGIGPIFWLLIAEVFPPEARGPGVGLCTAANWLSNFAVGLAFLPLASAIGTGPAFWIFAGVSVAAFLFVKRYVPETRGRSFSEIDAELRARFG